MPEMNDYVRKEVFDARMDRMEMLLEKTVTEIKAENTKFREDMRTEFGNFKKEVTVEIDGIKQELGNLRTEIGEVKNETRLLSVRIDSQENVLYWGFSIFGIIFASAVIIPAVVAFIKKLFTPSVSLEDIERIAKEVTARAIAELQGGQIK